MLREGDSTDALYIVRNGIAEGIAAAVLPTAPSTSRGMGGELAMVHERTRSASVRTQSRADLIKDIPEFLNLVANDPEFSLAATWVMNHRHRTRCLIPQIS